MNSPIISALATAVPERQYDQTEIAERYLAVLPDQSRARAVHKIFTQTGVQTRYTAADEIFFSVPRGTQDRNDRYMDCAIPLGRRALEILFEHSEYNPQDIDTFTVVSCTGYGVPGLDLHLAQQMNMRSDLRRTCVLGMGCYGAIPGLRNARNTLVSGQNQVALVLAVELCSLHLQFELTSENIVSAALFSDGAAAALVTLDPISNSVPMPKLLNFKTHCDYNTMDDMAFTLTDTGFLMHLSSYVPELLTSHVENFVDDLLSDYDLKLDDIHTWAIHPGSSKIVEFVRNKLHLAPECVQSSHDILRDYGNMSSPTILFVLEHIQRTQRPPKGSYGVMMAFGPGLTIEGILLQW
ncbi:MAG: 3-oxoacyl-[acyl-carrier-protein] synthase III C-terminal domain-containing protein [Chloroflexota bacterium]